MDEDAGSALVRVIATLLTRTSFRRVIVDLCDVAGVDRFARDAIEQLRTIADARDRQLAVLVAAPVADDALDARRRRRRPRFVASSASCRSYAAFELRAS